MSLLQAGAEPGRDLCPLDGRTRWDSGEPQRTVVWLKTRRRSSHPWEGSEMEVEGV